MKYQLTKLLKYAIPDTYESLATLNPPSVNKEAVEGYRIRSLTKILYAFVFKSLVWVFTFN